MTILIKKKKKKLPKKIYYTLLSKCKKIFKGLFQKLFCEAKWSIFIFTIKHVA